jgi:hypothetical protein
MIRMFFGICHSHIYWANLSDTVGTVLLFVIAAVLAELVVNKIEKC